MTFIKYQKEKTNKGGTSRTIGINRKGRFVFYKPVVQKYLMNNEFIDLYFDPESNKIGIEPVAEPSADSFKIKGKTTKMVIAKKFLNRFQIPVEDKRYEYQHENGMLTIQL